MKMGWLEKNDTILIGARPRISRLAVAGFALSALAIGAAWGAGWGTRMGWWDFRQGFRILRWAAYLGAAGGVVAIPAAYASRPGGGRRGFVLAVAGIVFGAVAFGVPTSWQQLAKRYPMIHDISTDTENPPRFDAVLALRKNASNPSEYGGPEIAAKQHEAYPDLRPVPTALPADEAYAAALKAAREMHWRIVAQEPGSGRIEAVATTRWFGFKDDVVIRISPAAGGSVLDIRSASRVGIGDLGTNARRIREFRRTFLDFTRGKESS